MKIIQFLLFLISFLFLLAASTSAQDLVYEPKNPAFGGHPGNYSWLKNSADTQNLFEEDFSSGRFERDPLEDFKNSLQRQVLSQLTRDLVLRQFGEGEEIQESRFEFGEFVIEVIPGLDGIQLRIFNILTGDETSITIPNF
ncbi:MAG: curli assembly protein CsgF [Balneolaceae bacterium]|nr:curli assembly protein CsgF [Balneolaceae bacterium]MDR9408026.1 curli assembly protein CsgF [Balneolaceae bacterium]